MKTAICLLLLCGCAALPGPRFTEIEIGGVRFTAEIADTPEKQALGLMHRRSIAPDFAMLFVFPEEEIRSFWMKNCHTHLDIIYLNRRRQVVDLHASVPPCREEPCPSYVSALPAQYVVELRGGRARELNLKIGDAIAFVY